MRLGIFVLSFMATATSAFASNAVRPGANGVKFASAFADAGPVAKLIVLGLILAALWAVALAVLNATRRNRPPQGRDFIAGLRLGGVLVALAGVVFLAMNTVIRVVYEGGIPPFIVWAPALAEMLLILLAGLIASAVAVLLHPHFHLRPAN